MQELTQMTKKKHWVVSVMPITIFHQTERQQKINSQIEGTRGHIYIFIYINGGGVNASLCGEFKNMKNNI